MDSVDAIAGYGNKSLHAQSHGESFLSLLQHRFSRSGFYVMDEPEAALSPQRQLAFLVLLHDLLENNRDSVSHGHTFADSAGLSGAQIFSFDDGQIHEIEYRDSSLFQLANRFMSAPEHFVEMLLKETDVPKSE